MVWGSARSYRFIDAAKDEKAAIGQGGAGVACSAYHSSVACNNPETLSAYIFGKVHASHKIPITEQGMPLSALLYLLRAPRGAGHRPPKARQGKALRPGTRPRNRQPVENVTSANNRVTKHGGMRLRVVEENGLEGSHTLIQYAST